MIADLANLGPGVWLLLLGIAVAFGIWAGIVWSERRR